MIKICKRGFVTKYDIFFADKPSYNNWLMTNYIQAKTTIPVLGFHRKPKYTKFIYLTDLEYENYYDKKTLYEIRRALKERVSCEISSDIKGFISMYKIMVKEKGLEKVLNLSDIQSYGENFILTVAKLNDEIVVYHSYLLDKSIRRIRLLHSVSKIYNDTLTANQKSIIGMSNRLLHSWDMECFQKQGIEIYDFGGYAFNTSNVSLAGINKFKDSFGGVLVEESIYEAYPKYIVKKLISNLKKIIS